MRKCVMLLAAILFSTLCFSQVKNPVQWNFTSKRLDATTYEVHLTATLEKGWHVYSQTTPDGGPVATAISFAKNPLINLQGVTKEIGKLEKRFEPLFGVDVKQFSDEVVFVQTVELKGKVKTTLNGSIEFMSCNDHECLPPATKKFSLILH